jgi:hypothetical protein
MSMRSAIVAAAFALSVALVTAPQVAADTCCANAPITFDPPSAMPGDTVRLSGIACLNADNTGPLALDLGGFWLAKTNRPAQADPDTAPGPNLPPPPIVEGWLPFASVNRVMGPGDATIVVPDLPDGRYQLWWWCDNGAGPGGGIHYSPGPRLTIGDPPDTATVDARSAVPEDRPALPAAPFLALGVGVFAVLMRRQRFGR